MTMKNYSRHFSLDQNRNINQCIVDPTSLAFGFQISFFLLQPIHGYYNYYFSFTYAQSWQQIQFRTTKKCLIQTGPSYNQVGQYISNSFIYCQDSCIYIYPYLKQGSFLKLCSRNNNSRININQVLENLGVYLLPNYVVQL